MATSIFYEMAALRFRGKTISGSGPLAVVLDCSNRVVLCDTPMAAQITCQAECKPLGCQHGEHRWHRIVELNRTRPQDIRPPVVPAWWNDSD
jgi:hypothetical protein